MSLMYLEIAEILAYEPLHRELGRRYLAIHRRTKVIEKAMSGAPVDNPLASVDFHPPLSVAGQPSSVIVRAENMSLRGIPVAFDFDDKGQHRGVPIWKAAESLQMALERPVSDVEVLGWYADLMGRNARLSRRLSSLRGEKQSLRPRLQAAMLPGRFTCAMSREVLEVALSAWTITRKQEGKSVQSATVGYRNKHLSLDGYAIACAAGMGSGIGVILISHLHSVLAGSRNGDVLLFRFGDSDWEVEVVSGETTVEEMKFGYL